MKRVTLFALALALMLSAALPAMAEDALYTAIVTRNYPNSTTNVYKEMDTDSTKLKWLDPGAKLTIFAVYPGWVKVQSGNTVGYILRHRVDNVEPIDPVNTPHYGVEKYQYYAVLSQPVDLYNDKSHDAKVLTSMTPGAYVSIIGIEEGWAKLIYHRQYAYIDTRLLTELLPVAPDAESALPGEPIAVYMTFFSNNENRINNLRVACSRMNRVMQPGDELLFNDTVGRFTAANGYLPAPVLIDGELVSGYGGGSCQVSSTLYNVVLQLPGLTVTERSPHGANGASYLPHGVDASSGDLDFHFRNDYPFAVRVDSHIQDFGMFIVIYKEGVR